jgi:hypothetical protein
MLLPYLALLLRKEKSTILGEVKKISALHRERNIPPCYEQQTSILLPWAP